MCCTVIIAFLHILCKKLWHIIYILNPCWLTIVVNWSVWFLHLKPQLNYSPWSKEISKLRGFGFSLLYLYYLKSKYLALGRWQLSFALAANRSKVTSARVPIVYGLYRLSCRDFSEGPNYFHSRVLYGQSHSLVKWFKQLVRPSQHLQTVLDFLSVLLIEQHSVRTVLLNLGPWLFDFRINASWQRGVMLLHLVCLPVTISHAVELRLCCLLWVTNMGLPSSIWRLAHLLSYCILKANQAVGCAQLDLEHNPQSSSTLHHYFFLYCYSHLCFIPLPLSLFLFQFCFLHMTSIGICFFLFRCYHCLFIP